MDSIANEAQIAANQGNIKGTFNSIGRLTSDVWPNTVPIRDKEGKTIMSLEGQMQRWKEYLEEILSVPTPLLGKEEAAGSPPTTIIRVINKL